ncbi:MAG: alpha/beta fold hydrolase [Crocinitomicaceae bacterium]
MKNVIYSAVIVAITLVSCTKQETETFERFYFRNDGADLAVQVDGNIQSKVFILLLHGGPGGGAGAYNEGYSADQLEEKYAMVYMDQRGNGASQGSFSSEDLTLEQNSKDVYALTLFLKQKYGSDISIFLMGHSWGGITSAHALINTDIQSELKGWIEVDGGHDFVKNDIEAVKMFLEIGNEQVALGNSLDFWNGLLPDIEAIDTNDISSQEQGLLNSKGFEAEGQIPDIASNGPEGNPSDFGLFTNPDASIAVYMNNQAVNPPLNEDSQNNPLTDRLNEITIPSQFLWGKYDFVVPPALGVSGYNNVGTSDKELVIFQFSGHSPMDNEPVLFVQEVSDFIELYK